MTPHLINWVGGLQQGSIGVLRLEFVPEPSSGLLVAGGNLTAGGTTPEHREGPQRQDRHREDGEPRGRQPMATRLELIDDLRQLGHRRPVPSPSALPRWLADFENEPRNDT